MPQQQFGLSQHQLTAAPAQATVAAAHAYRHSRRLHDHALEPLLRWQLDVSAANGLHLCQQGNSSSKQTAEVHFLTQSKTPGHSLRTLLIYTSCKQRAYNALLATCRPRHGEQRAAERHSYAYRLLRGCQVQLLSQSNSKHLDRHRGCINVSLRPRPHSVCCSLSLIDVVGPTAASPTCLRQPLCVPKSCEYAKKGRLTMACYMFGFEWIWGLAGSVSQ
jgi:hypothetical protein